MTYQLTAYERETNIIMNDDDELARIITYQKSVIAKLRKNPAAHESTDLGLKRLGGAKFEVPAKLVSFRSPRALTAERRAALAANAATARAATKNTKPVKGT